MDSQGEPGLKRHLRVYAVFLGLPLLSPLGLLTPFFEQSTLFAEGGWWKSLTLVEQGTFVLTWWAIWASAVTVFAILLSFFFSRWREKVWGPVGGGIRQGISMLGLLLLGRAGVDRLVEQEIRARTERAAADGPPKGRHSGAPGVMIYGDVITRSSIYDTDLSVEWGSTGLPFGKLVPAPGNTWEVQYGHFETKGIYPELVIDEKLGRVQTASQGVERLRERDLREGLNVHR